MDFVDWIFVFNQKGGLRRSRFFIAVSVLLWLGLTLIIHPLQQNNQPWILQLVRNLFALDVLRHFMVLGLAFWLGRRLAAIYLDDIFELNDILVAERFIQQAAFSGHYETLRIKDGEVDPDQSRSPIKLIGGPGWVDVHLENVSLFERVNGIPHVIGPTDRKREPLEGFERLRAVVPLKDHILDLTVDSRTQDGIRITAKDVRLVFSVFRGIDPWTPDQAYQQPYPFAPQSIENIVYRHKLGRDPWFAIAKYLIREELEEFISQHVLSEFLTNAYIGTQFIQREQITNLFYDFAHGFTERAERRGIELHWIGVGTWETPSKIIPDRHLEAWNLTCENRVRRSPHILDQVREENRFVKLLSLIDEIVTTFHTLMEQETKPEQVMIKLIRAYRKKLIDASVVYTNQDEPIPDELEAAIRHLTDLGAYFVGGT